MSATLRPMVAGDTGAAARLWAAAWSALAGTLGEEPRRFDDEALGHLAARYDHLLGTDPGGCLVAEDGHDLVGLAVAHLRGGRFMLANLAVAPAAQGRGIGRSLLERALAHGADASSGLICSSPDPRALRRYLSAGFRCSPAMEAVGHTSEEVRPPATLRQGTASRGDLELVDALDQQVRHSTRRADIRFLLDDGAELWVDDVGAYGVVRADEVLAVCASEARLGRRLLAALLAGQVTGRPLTARWLTAAEPWAFAAANDAGASLKGHGAVMTRGRPRQDGAYLPNGALG